jgi:hypothetical protein
MHPEPAIRGKIPGKDRICFIYSLYGIDNHKLKHYIYTAFVLFLSFELPAIDPACSIIGKTC